MVEGDGPGRPRQRHHPAPTSRVRWMGVSADGAPRDTRPPTKPETVSGFCSGRRPDSAISTLPTSAPSTPPAHVAGAEGRVCAAGRVRLGKVAAPASHHHEAETCFRYRRRTSPLPRRLRHCARRRYRRDRPANGHIRPTSLKRLPGTTGRPRKRVCTAGRGSTREGRGTQIRHSATSTTPPGLRPRDGMHGGPAGCHNRRLPAIPCARYGRLAAARTCYGTLRQADEWVVRAYRVTPGIWPIMV